jgi:hypothetical protein
VFSVQNGLAATSTGQCNSNSNGNSNNVPAPSSSPSLPSSMQVPVDMYDYGTSFSNSVGGVGTVVTPKLLDPDPFFLSFFIFTASRPRILHFFYFLHGFGSQINTHESGRILHSGRF